MKKLIQLLLLLFLFVNTTKAGEKEDINNLVYKWNELHNTRETALFKEIYAPTVLFYGKVKSRQTCFQNKDGFLNEDFKQEIISPVSLIYYSSGTVKCTFIKKVVYKGLVKKHDCYLLLKQDEDKWYITGESDLVTDKNLHVQLDLGEELVSTGMSKTPFVTGGLALLALGGILVYRRRKRKEHEGVYAAPIESVPVEPAVHITQPNVVIETEKIVATVKEAVLQEIGTQIKDAPKELSEADKGTLFEKYVVSRFTKEYFELKEWRGDKYHEGVYATSNQLPDLEYYFRTKSQFAKFAVECKWRSEFFKGRIEWAKGYQLNNYRDYQRKRNVPVFVVIGIGGTPDDPESVYVVPLENIRSNVLTERELAPYYRYKKGNFYLNLGHNFMELE